MNYKDILSQWNGFIDDVQLLQENIKACLDEKGYESEQEEQDLRIMRRGCYELHRILLGYFD